MNNHHTVHIQNVERQNVKRQNVERQNVERQNVDEIKRRIFAELLTAEDI
jgi:hypothetical protein